MNSQKPEWFLIKNSGRFVVNSKRNQAQIELMRMYEQEVECFWTAAIFDVASDTVQFKTLSENEQKYIKNVLAFFAGFDGLVNENLAVNFYEEVQLNEARLFYGFQIAMEGIHGQTYSLMLETFVTDPKERENLLNGLETIPAVKKKADWAIKWINDKRSSFGTRLIAFACIEGIFFSGAFCSIFWLKKRGLMPGLTFSNELISRDEGLHCDFACLLYTKHLTNMLPKEQVAGIIQDAVEIEKEFVTDALPVRLIGMNSDLMSQYIEFVADRLLVELGNEKIYNAKNPFGFMEMISIQGKTNFFEKRVGEYQKAGVLSGDNSQTFSTDEDF